eukprot:scaffold11.g3871.t1
MLCAALPCRSPSCQHDRSGGGPARQLHDVRADPELVLRPLVRACAAAAKAQRQAGLERSGVSWASSVNLQMELREAASRGEGQPGTSDELPEASAAMADEAEAEQEWLAAPDPTGSGDAEAGGEEAAEAEDWEGDAAEDAAEVAAVRRGDERLWKGEEGDASDGHAQAQARGKRSSRKVVVDIVFEGQDGTLGAALPQVVAWARAAAAAASGRARGRGGTSVASTTVVEAELSAESVPSDAGEAGHGKAQVCGCVGDRPPPYPAGADLTPAVQWHYVAARLAICQFTCGHQALLSILLAVEVAVCLVWALLLLLRGDVADAGGTGGTTEASRGLRHGNSCSCPRALKEGQHCCC